MPDAAIPEANADAFLSNGEARGDHPADKQVFVGPKGSHCRPPAGDVAKATNGTFNEAAPQHQADTERYASGQSGQWQTSKGRGAKLRRRKAETSPNLRQMIQPGAQYAHNMR